MPVCQMICVWTKKNICGDCGGGGGGGSDLGLHLYSENGKSFKGYHHKNNVESI